jgi:tetratricopeptide (TPR) repeat protein
VLAAGAIATIVVASGGNHSTPSAIPIDAMVAVTTTRGVIDERPAQQDATSPADARLTGGEEPENGASAEERAHLLTQAGKQLLFQAKPDYPQATIKFRQSLLLFPTVEAYFDLGLAYYSDGYYTQALVALAGLGTMSPPEPWLQNAVDLRNLVIKQMKEQGIPIPERPMSLPPNGAIRDPDPTKRAAALDDDGVELLLSGDLKGALATFHKAIDSHEEARFYVHIAIVEEQLGDYPAAMTATKRLLAMSPGDDLARWAARMSDRLYLDTHGKPGKQP